ELVAVFPNLNHIESYEWTKNNKFLNNNFWFYTLFWTIGSTIFYTVYFQKILQIKLFKDILKYSRYVFILVAFVLIFKDFNKLFKTGYTLLDYINTLLVVGSVILYFIEVLLTNKILKFYRNINFYIASSVFIWWLITMPLSIFGEYYHENDLDFVNLNRTLIYISNIFMYSCFAIGLIVSKPEQEIN
ncbi:MAG: hypothetical protein ACPG6B_08095, partial [Oceanihabitans sp.]